MGKRIRISVPTGGPELLFRYVPDFLDGVDGDEGVGIDSFQIIHQYPVFLLVHNGDDFLSGLIVVSADAFVDGSAAVEIVENELADLFKFRRQNTDLALEIQTKDKVIHDQTAEIGGQNTEYHSLLVIAEGRGKGYQHTGQGDGLTDFHVKKFVHQLCHNVQTAGGCVAGEKNGLTDADDQNIADNIQKRIAGNGQVVGKQNFQQTQEARHNQRSINGFYAELGPDQKIADNQQNSVDRKGDHGNGKGKEIAEYQSQCRYAAHGDLAGKHEKVHRNCHDGRTGGECQKFFETEFCFHKIPPKLEWVNYIIQLRITQIKLYDGVPSKPSCLFVRVARLDCIFFPMGRK